MAAVLRRNGGIWPFAARILVILAAPVDQATAQATIRRAKEQALRPALLRFAVPKELDEGLHSDDADVLYYAGGEPLEGCAALVTDEACFLLLSGAHAFAPHWDAALIAALRSLPGQQTLLTGSMTHGAAPSGASPVPPEDAPTIRVPKVNANGLHTLRQSLPAIRQRTQAAGHPPKPETPEAPPEACLPALKSSCADNSIWIGRGLALVCAAAPVATLIVDPAFVFGSVRFLQEETLALNSLSLTAYMTGYSVYALHEAVLWPLADLPRRMLQLPETAVQPGTTAARFAQLLGLAGGQQRTQAKAAMGLFGPAETYEQRMPTKLLLSQRANAARMKLWEMHIPLMVSAYIDLPDVQVSPDFYTLRFGFLNRIQSLPLLLYTGGSQERLLRSMLPNTQSYPDQQLLPRTLLEQGMKPAQHFVRSKPMLMLRASRRQVEFSHVAWLDMDTLSHPVPADAVPDFSELMDDRIHLATVGGVPDASFVVVPARYLPHLSRETLSITQLDAELKRGFEEPLLWERLFVKHPEWFAIHSMPVRRMLFLTGFDKRLLSTAIARRMNDLPKPHYGSSDEKERTGSLKGGD